MANEELIYRITRAVYGRLGSAVDEQTIEQLVTEIYREFQDAFNKKTLSSARLFETSAGVSQILAEAECSIIDINQTVVQGKFAMVIIADTTRARESATALKERLRIEGEKLGVRIYAQREDLFNAMHRI